MRTVAYDNTIRLEERLVQIPPGPRRRSYARCRVELQERLDGELVVVQQGTIVARQAGIPGAPLVARKRRRGRELAADPRPPRTPAEPIPDVDLPADLLIPAIRPHPWRTAPMIRPKQKNGPQRQRAEARLSIPSKQAIIPAPGSK